MSYVDYDKICAMCLLDSLRFMRGCPGRDIMVVGFATTYAISAHHH